MKPFSKTRISLLRAAQTSANGHVFRSSNLAKANKRLVGVVTALLGIALACVLVPSPARAGAPDSKQPDAATVARARAAFIKSMSSRRPMVRSSVKPLTVAGVGATGLGSYNWSGFARPSTFSIWSCRTNSCWCDMTIARKTGRVRAK